MRKFLMAVTVALLVIGTTAYAAEVPKKALEVDPALVTVPLTISEVFGVMQALRSVADGVQHPMPNPNANPPFWTEHFVLSGEVNQHLKADADALTAVIGGYQKTVEQTTANLLAGKAVPASGTPEKTKLDAELKAKLEPEFDRKRPVALYLFTEDQLEFRETAPLKPQMPFWLQEQLKMLIAPEPQSAEAKSK